MKLQCNLNLGTGAMPLRWCLEASEQEMIVAKGNKYPYLVIIDTFYGEQRQSKDRQVLPLEAMMCYVPFCRPGVARVCVAVVQVQSADDSAIQKVRKQFWARRDDGYFSECMFDVSGDTVEPDYMARRGNMYEVLAYADEKISVPQEFFGAPWSTWLMWWVTWFPRNLLRRKLIDECDRRRWLMFSIFPQPIILVVWYALMVCWMVANTIVKLAVAAYLDGMLGMRKIDWKCVFDTDATPSDVWFDAGRSGWSSQYYTRANGEARSGWHQFVQPSSLIFVAGVFMATSTFQAQALIPFLLSLLAAIIAIPGVVVLMVRLTLGALGARFKQRSNDRWVQEQKRHQEIIAEGEQAFRLEIAALSCPLDFVPVLPLTVSALPPQKRTLSLRYQELKAKVCRPLA